MGPPSAPFRWVMLGLTFVGGLCQNLLWLSLVPLVLAVERDLGLTAAQVAFWVNLPVTCGVFLCIPIGLIIDRWGAKRVGRLGVALLALGALARGLAGSYGVLLAASAVFGIGYMTFFVSQSKSLAVWFPASEIGMATGVFLTGTGVGSALGLSLVQPAFGNSWQSCFLLLGWFGVATAVLWWVLAKEPTPLQEAKAPETEAGKIGTSFKRILKTAVIWLLVIGFFCYVAGFQSWFTFGFPFLVRFKGMSENSSAIVLTLTMVGYTVAAISMPALSDRWGRRKPFLLFFAALGFVLFLVLPLAKSAALVWLAALVLGMCFGCINPLVFTVAAEARDLGPALMGVSLGTIISLGSVAGLLIPVVIGNFLGTLSSATEEAFRIVWLVTAVWLGGIFLCGLLLKETGPISRTSSV